MIIRVSLIHQHIDENENRITTNSMFLINQNFWSNKKLTLSHTVTLYSHKSYYRLYSNRVNINVNSFNTNINYYSCLNNIRKTQQNQINLSRVLKSHSIAKDISIVLSFMQWKCECTTRARRSSHSSILYDNPH